jgi:hypothetical protein
MIASVEVGDWTYSNVEYGEQEHGKGMNVEKVTNSDKKKVKKRRDGG